MKVDENLLAAIFHAEWMRWSDMAVGLLGLPAEAVAPMRVPYDSLSDDQKAPFLESAKKVMEMFDRETKPNV